MKNKPALFILMATLVLSIIGTNAFAVSVAIPQPVAAINTTTGVKFSWSQVTGSTGYYIYRKTTGSWVNIAKVTGAATISYTDKNVVTGTKYTYTVRAYVTSSANMSGYDATGKSVVYVATPVLISAVNATTGVKFSWGQVAGATGYYVYRKTTGSWTNIAQIAGVSSTSYLDTKVLPGSKYTYTVRAYKTSGSNMSSYDSIGKSVLFLKISPLVLSSK